MKKVIMTYEYTISFTENELLRLREMVFSVKNNSILDSRIFAKIQKEFDNE